MWFKIVTNKDGSVASCEQVDVSKDNGKTVHYVEASNKSEAIELILSRYRDNAAKQRERDRARRDKLRSANLCARCGKNNRSDGMSICFECSEKDAARQRKQRQELKLGRPKLWKKNESDDDRIKSQINRQKKDIEKARKKANGSYIIVRVAYARCLQAFDSMTPNAYRTWLSEQLKVAQDKENASADRNNRIYGTAAE